MVDQRLKHLPRRIFLEHAACTYVLASPVLAYYTATSFGYVEKNIGLFFQLVGIAALASLVLMVVVNMTAMRSLRRCIRAIIEGSAQGQLIEKAVRSTRRFPLVYAVEAFFSWAILANFVLLTPFVLMHAIAPAELWGTLGLTVSTGVVMMPLFYLIAQSESSLFLHLPTVQKASMTARGGGTDSLSRKILLCLFALISYPVFILTDLILLSNSGTVDLRGSSTGLVLLILVTIVTSLLVGLMIARSIARPLKEASESAALISQGHLDVDLAVTTNDEVGRLSESLNRMTSRLREMVQAISANSQEVASSSEQIRASAQKLSEGAQSQASTLQETSASVEVLTASVEQVSEHAQSQVAAVGKGSSSMAQVQQSIEDVSKNLTEIAGLADRSVDNALEGATAVSDVMEGINLIAGSSEKIGGIVTVISEIANQTNLLALNAAIEAARAGEHGRGFAVVADEVSKLADRSSTSTKEIEALIEESVKNVTRGVEKAKGSQFAMEQIRAASQKVKEMIAGLLDSMTQQVHAVKELSRALSSVSEMSQSISAATEEQTTTSRQVSKAVENVNDVTQTTAAAAEELSAATEQLSQMSQSLRSLTEQFNVGNSKTA